MTKQPPGAGRSDAPASGASKPKKKRKPNPPFENRKVRNPLEPNYIAIDLPTVRNLAKIGATQDEIAQVCGVSVATFKSRRLTEPALERAYQGGLVKGKTTLRRKQWQGAMRGDKTMLVWLGKQMLGQRDQLQITEGQNDLPPPDFSNCTDEELETLREASAIIKRKQQEALDRLNRSQAGGIIEGAFTTARPKPPPLLLESDSEQDA